MFQNPAKSMDTVTREEVLANIQDSDDSLCCIPCCKQTNKVLPSLAQPYGTEFFTFKHNRKIRIINRYPLPKESPLSESQSEIKTVEERLSDGEEYWFESAAPHRLPVVQPPPSVPVNRIINKFEPRVNPSITNSRKASLDNDLISPGRLPRKNFNTENLQDDDYEDEAEGIEGEELKISKDQPDYSMGPAIASNSDMILDITKETTNKTLSTAQDENNDDSNNDGDSEVKDSLPESENRSPTPNSDTDSDTPAQGSPVPRAASLSPTRAASSTPSREAALTPSREATSTPTRTKSPDPADDSCHPSPEVPHRTVCAAPNPLDENDEEEPFSSLRIAGENMGVANKGFSMEENGKSEDEVNDDDKDTPASSDVDAGYARQRELNKTIENTLSQVTKSSTESQIKNDPKLPILFFIHGVGGSADIWNSQLNYFSSKGYHVIAPDMLGHGFSSCPDKASAYKFTKLFKDFITIFDAYIPDDRKAIVIGHSYGCSFSAALARTRPEKIAALVLLASGGPTPLAPPVGLYKYPKWIMSAYRVVLECKFRNQQHKYNPRGKTIKFKEAFDVPAYVFKYVMLGQVWPEGDAGFHRRITAPTLLAYGMRDTLVSLVEECEMERTIPKVIF